jgi:hypothetical protein
MSDQNMKQIDALVAFLKAPSKDIPVIYSKGEKFAIMVPLFLLDIALALFSGAIISIIVKEFGLLEGHKMTAFMNDRPAWFIIFYGVMLAPVIEEFFFRLHLRINEKYLQLNVILMITGLIYILASIINVRILQICLIALEVLLLAIYLIKKEQINTYLLTIWERKYFSVFYISSSIFALLHISNYDPKAITYLLIPILVLPQFVLGVLCGFLRLRLGFIWGIIFHSGHNLLFLSPLIVSTLLIYISSNTVKITEHNSLNNVNTIKVSNDTVEFNRATLIDIISNLKKINKDKTVFEDSLLAAKILSVEFHRKTIPTNKYQSSSTTIVINELEKKYKLKLEPIPAYKEVYQIEIFDSSRLNLVNRRINDTVITRNIPYLENEDITLHNVDFKFLAKAMDRFYSKQVVDSSNNNKKYTILIPRTGFNKLNKYFEDQYGFRFKRISTEVTGYKISSK